MKRKFMLTLLAFVAVVATTNPSFGDVIIYDSFRYADGSDVTRTISSSQPRNLVGDTLNTLATPNPNQVWQVNSASFRIWLTGSGEAGVNRTYEDVTMRVRFYESFDADAPIGTSVFSDLVSDFTFSLGTLINTSESGGNQSTVRTLDYLQENAQFLFQTGQNIGFSVDIRSAGEIENGLGLMLMRDNDGEDNPRGHFAGSSPRGWYRDGRGNGILESDELRQLSNYATIKMTISATAIPEPGAGALLLGLCCVPFIKRRR